MARLTAKEIDQAHRDDYLEQDLENDIDYEMQCRFVEPEDDEVIEEPYDYHRDDWLFEDTYLDSMDYY